MDRVQENQLAGKQGYGPDQSDTIPFDPDVKKKQKPGREGMTSRKLSVHN
jgi:hypothetical protein